MASHFNHLRGTAVGEHRGVLSTLGESSKLRHARCFASLLGPRNETSAIHMPWSLAIRVVLSMHAYHVETAGEYDNEKRSSKMSTHGI